MRRLRRLTLLGVTVTLAVGLALRALIGGFSSGDTVADLPSVVSLIKEENGSDYYVHTGSEPYPWHYFEMSKSRRQVIPPGADEAKRAPQAGPELEELSAVLNSSLTELQQRTGDDQFSYADALGGRYRLLPGVEVQYELYFRTRDEVRAGFHTVRVTRALEPLRVQYSGKGGQQVVNVLLPYYNRLEALRQFAGRFAALVEAGQKTVLTVIRYTDGFPTMDAHQQRQDGEGVAQVVREINQRLAGYGSKPRVRLLERSGTFSRGMALMEGARASEDEEDMVLFLCDVDMLFGAEFLQRCRANTVPARQAYFPIVFSTFNPKIVYDVINKPVVPVLTSYKQHTAVGQETGSWTTFGFGMSCQYRSDFQSLSGTFFNITGWGMEDIRLYQRFKESDIEIMRMADPDLVHVYHKKECNKHEVGKRFNSCLRSKAMKEASKIGWGLWVYKHVGDIEDVEAFLMKFYNNG